MMLVLGAVAVPVPVLGRWVERIPSSIASAMLAGVLLPFCLTLFRLGTTQPLLVALLIAVFIVARWRVPLHALLPVLAAGMLLALLRGDMAPLPPGATIGSLFPIAPAFAQAIVSIGLPLFLVTLVSQNLHGPGGASGRRLRPDARAAPDGNRGGLPAGRAVQGACGQPRNHHRRDLHEPRGASVGAVDRRRDLCGVPPSARDLLAGPGAPLPRAAARGDRGADRARPGPGADRRIDATLAPREDRDPAILTFLATSPGLSLFGLESPSGGCWQASLPWAPAPC
jgi:benzoate membrane transport protein